MALRFLLALALGLAGSVAAEADAPAPPPDFDRAVAPILAQHCLDCHSGPKPKGGLDLSREKAALAGAESGPAVVAGRLAESPLWLRVEEGEMPPKAPLSGAEKATLRAWVEAGAKWGSDPIDPFRLTTARRAGYDWWALQPVVRPEPPSTHVGVGSRNPIDSFVRAKLASQGLAPSPEADRRALIRRVSFDLVGLPPSPEEVAAFASDPDPLAYERLVDRLLASPHHGERWARHWLDVARFGESDGFERNATRANAWPYRNWVIDALNRDLPYDEFARQQIAGDLLRPGETDAALATGFLVAGVHNTVLGNDMMRAVAKQDELEDLVGAVGQTFLGLTVNCARCHDHKFDPIPQADYYRLASALGGVEPGEREFTVDDARRRAEALAVVATEAAARLDAIERPARLAILAERLGHTVPDAAPVPLAAWDFRAGRRDPLPGSPRVHPEGGARLTPDGAVLDGRGAFLRTEPFAVELRAKTLEAWVRLDTLSQRGGGVMSLQRVVDGSAFDAIVFAENEPGRWMAGSEGFARTRPLQGPAETQADGRAVQVALVYDADGTVRGYRDGQPYGQPYKSAGPATFPASQAVVLFGLRHEPPGGNRMLAGTVEKARLYDRALSAGEVAASSAAGGEFATAAEVVARLGPVERGAWDEASARLAELRADRAAAEARARFRAYVTVPGPAPVTRLLARGQVTEPGAVMTPGGVGSVGGPSASFGLAADAPEAERRKALAAWVTGTDNPLFTRVLVNRVWHHHFGVGLVETPNDFGFNGGRPSHPALLDWLASEFAAGGYRIKSLHRLIVTSATYRQSASPRADALARDAENRGLWRFSPRRLEGEAVRDAVLAVSGRLNREVGGRGFSDYRETFLNGTTYFDPTDPAGPEFERRSVYRFLPRGANQGLLDTLDCPDPSGAAPRRATTTTPVQALALWNNAFVLRMAEALAARVEAEVPGAPSDPAVRERRVRRLWDLTFQRAPGPDDLAPALELVGKHGLRALGRAAFNASAFLTVE